MSKEDDFLGVVDLIYGAVLDDPLWSTALTRLADVMETAHIGLCAMDGQAKAFDSIVPRTDPDWDARYKQYWAFHNPLWALSTGRPVNEVYFLDDLMPREDFAATPVYNEWWHPAGFGLGNMAANLHVSDEASALIFVANAPGNDQITGLMRLEVPLAGRFRRRNFASTGQAPVPARERNPAKSARERHRTSLAWLAASGGHRHGQQPRMGEMAQLTGAKSFALQRVQIAHHYANDALRRRGEERAD